MRIVDFRQAVADAIKTKLPDLRECRPYGGRFDLGELAAVSARAPAVFVAVLRSSGNAAYGDGRRQIPLNMAAYVVTADSRDADRDETALNLCEILQGWIPHNRFGTAQCADPGEVRWANLYSGRARGKGVALMAVTWRQDLVVGEPDDQTEDPPVPDTVWLGCAPRIGLGNEPHYEEVTAHE